MMDKTVMPKVQKTKEQVDTLVNSQAPQSEKDEIMRIVEELAKRPKRGVKEPSRKSGTSYARERLWASRSSATGLTALRPSC